MSVRIINGDCLVELPKLAAAGERFHCAVTDPPYELGFMGKSWDRSGVAFNRETWRAVYDCLLPGAHLLAFGGTRTQHRMVCAIEDAGFEVRDTLMWVFGAGFPKSLDVSKAIDKAAGAVREVVGIKSDPRYLSPRTNSPNHMDRARGVEGGHGADSAASQVTAPATPEAAQWSGWGTALKPAVEMVCVARKPLDGTVAGNVLKHGTGALNIDASRIAVDAADNIHAKNPHTAGTIGANGIYGAGVATMYKVPTGRWPANLLHDGSEEVLAAFAEYGESRPATPRDTGFRPDDAVKGGIDFKSGSRATYPLDRGDSGTAARFFYSAKADASDRQGSKHPTVKPTDLMRYLVRLVCPPNGVVLDPFAGTGSTGLAADQLGFDAVLIEQDATYAEDARRKLAADAPLLSVIS